MAKRKSKASRMVDELRADLAKQRVIHSESGSRIAQLEAAIEAVAELEPDATAEVSV